MKFTYLIKNTPDPINPNEQEVGNTIVDDRLYGYEVFSVGYDTATYTSQHINKPIFSNTLTIPITSWVNGDVVNVTLN